MTKKPLAEKVEQEASSARAAILARRKLFVASALAGVALGACDERPNVCLSIAPQPTATATTSEPQPCLSEPQPCLSVVPVDELDAGTGEQSEGGVLDAAAPDKPPARPCLSQRPPDKR